MNSKGLGDFAGAQRDMPVAEEQIIFVPLNDIELGTGNSQSLKIKVPVAAGIRVNDIVKVLPKKAGSRLVLPGKISEIQQGLVGEYVNVVVGAGDLERAFSDRDLVEGVYFETHWVTPLRERQLRIDLGLARVIRDPTDVAPPIHNGFAGELDGDNDGVIGTDEARRFAEGAIDWIKGEEGLKFSDLAKGIPAWLKVTDIQLNPVPRTYIGSIFNGVSLQVRRQDFADWLDIPAGQLQRNQFTGTEFDSGTGDVGSVDLKATLEEARIEFKAFRRTIIQPIGDTGLPWNVPKCYITMIDKTEGDLVMSRREVETIKKIKKCGKCFYRIVLTDDGVVSGIRSGDYRESIFKLTMFQPL